MTIRISKTQEQVSGLALGLDAKDFYVLGINVEAGPS
jgi:hypothetical protein